MRDVELIVSANGCTDNTYWYLESLRQQFARLGFEDHFKIVWSDKPLGYAAATNAGIRAATSDLVMLLNNDVILLDQTQNFWLDSLAQAFEQDPSCGISSVIKDWSDPAGHNFAIFFCVMIHRKVFDKIGLLNTEYGTGGGEDTEFSIEAERAGFSVVQPLSKQYDGANGFFTGVYPIYHKGEGTMHDPNLVPNWTDIFWQNSVKLAKKYNPAWLAKKQITAEAVADHPISSMLSYDKVVEQLHWMLSEEEETKELFDEVITKNCYQVSSQQLQGLTVIDIGANQGMFSILAASLGATKVVALEPISTTFDRLSDNVARGNLQQRIVCIKNAVLGRANGPLAISVNPKSGHNSLYNQGQFGELVETTSLEILLRNHAQNQPVFLKLDCEGAEYDILYDSHPSIFDQVKYIAIEIHGDLHPIHKGVAALENKLASLGYSLVDKKDIGVWYYDQNGQVTKFEPLPQTIEIWSKK